ncbi:MAG: methyltransferase [Bacteroidota bacterium]
MNTATVIATDISSAAIDIAHKNSLTFNTEVEFLVNNVLTEDLPEADIIVSNPPYIAREEMLSMNKNVVDYEPHLALFVDDPMIFYKAIAAKKAWAVFCGDQ